MNTLGIDIGGTFTKYAVVDEHDQILKKWKKETKLFQDKDEFYDYLCEGLETGDIDCVGISAPGVLAPDSTIISKAAPNVQIMYGTNVNEEFQKRMQISVSALNDAKCAGLCEMKLGNGKGTQSSAYFVIGTGVGGCICNDHEVITGVNCVSGEFSQLPIGYYEDEPNRLKRLSDIASMTSLIDIYNEKAGDDKQVTYGEEVTDLYHQGDAAAIEAMEEWCKNVIWGLYTVIIFYNPEVICIGGGISKEDWFIDKIRDMMEHTVQHDFQDIITTRIDRCMYDNDANLLGAVLYARSRK